MSHQGQALQDAPARIDESIHYWRSHLADVPFVLDLPTDRPRPATRHGSNRRISMDFPATTLQAFGALHQLPQIQRDAALLGCLSTLLARYCTQDEFCLGYMPDASRDQLIPLRCTLTGQQTFTDLRRAIESELEGVQQHAALPFSMLVEALCPEMDSRVMSPIVQVALVSCNAQPEQDTAGQLPDACAQLDIALAIDAVAPSCLTIQFRDDLFDQSTILRFAGHFLKLLQASLDCPDADPMHADMLTAEERHQLLHDWNHTAASYEHECVHHLFERQAARTPDAPALVLGEQSLNYAALNARANQLAHYLIAQGVGSESLVGVCMSRSFDMIVAMLGILKAGGAYLPLDPAYPAQRLAFMIEDASPALILTQSALKESIPFPTTLCLDADSATIDAYPESDPERRATPDSLAYVIYTSGSTGRPKGVLLQHAGLANLCEAQGLAFEVTPSSRVLQFASISFDASVSETFVTLTRGACLYLIKPEALRSSFEILKLIEHEAISIVTLPPSLLAVLPVKPLPALRTLVLAGEAWPPELAKKWAGGRKMLNAYGPTEGTVCATWGQVDAQAGSNVPIGKPMNNVQLYILDSRMQAVPIGVPGEIFIGGIGLARGYLKRPELTAERFVRNPFGADASDRLYRTGDKARFRHDGNIEFLGRFDHQVKLRGFRIELGEIEAALSGIEGIQTASVIVREDHPGEKKLTAYLVTEIPMSFSGLKSTLRNNLPDYMIPQIFVLLNEMPMSPNGKVDRRALPPPNAHNKLI